MSAIPVHLPHLLADRHSPEAQAFFETLLRYSAGRVRYTWSCRYRNVLSQTELDDIVAEAGLRLVSGALARCRGTTVPEILAFVRTVCDRTLGRAARLRLRERDLLRRNDGEAVLDWYTVSPRPDAATEVGADCPFSAADQAYLLQLIEAGSLAEQARSRSQTRASVTRMVQRIRERFESLSDEERDAAEAWMMARISELIEVRERTGTDSNSAQTCSFPRRAQQLGHVQGH